MRICGISILPVSINYEEPHQNYLTIRSAFFGSKMHVSSTTKSIIIIIIILLAVIKLGVWPVMNNDKNMVK